MVFSSLIDPVLGRPHLWLSFDLKTIVVWKITILIKVLKSVAMHKSQGLIIGLGKYWDTVVVTLT